MVPRGPTQGNDSLPQSAGTASVAIVQGRARATAAPAIADALRDLLTHEVAAWESHGLSRIKERTVRSVFTGSLAGVPVHVKVFRAHTLADRARDTVLQARGEREFVNLGAARAHGLPTVEPLAFGTALDRDDKRSFVVTRTLVPARPFSFAAGDKVLRRVGTLLRSIHDTGVQPGDLHPDNLLIDAHGEPFLLDLTSVRFGSTPSLPRRAAALAFFCHELDGGAVDPGAGALLAAYLAAGALPATFDRELRLATHRWRARALGDFGRRAQRNCKHTFVPERRRAEPRWHWHLQAGGELDTVRARCRELLVDSGEPLRRGRRGAVWLLPDLAIKERDPGAARRLWLATYWLLFAKVHLAPPVALCLDRGRGLVFCRRVDSPSLALELAGGALDANAVRAAARSLGTTVGRLHAHGLRNRDLKLDNLLRDPASGEVCMVDLDGVRRASTTDTRGLGADLGRLLAAFRAAGSPGGDPTLRTFLRSYLRAHRRLLQSPSLRRILRRAETRAGEWRSAHR